MASPSKDPKLDIAKDVPEIESASTHARAVAEVNPIKASCKNADVKYLKYIASK